MRLFLVLAALRWIPALLGIAVWIIADRSRSLGALEAWAKDEGVRILRQSRRRLRPGPYFWTPSPCAVFATMVEVRDGRQRRAWVCVNDPDLNLSATTEIEVDWPPAERRSRSVQEHVVDDASQTRRSSSTFLVEASAVCVVRDTPRKLA